MIYLDYSKAFDSVSHSKLIHVLHHLQINSTLISWIKDYLTDRSQKTIVDGFYSDSCNITSGVPQGSVLGPLFYLAYTNDLLNTLSSEKDLTFYAYADDLKLSSTNTTTLQQTLNVIEKWSKLWQLKIQPTKSEHIIFNPPRHNSASNPTYYLENKPIPKTNVVRDLGIFITNDLKWETQINKIYSKAIVLVYTILRSFRTANANTYVKLFKTYIRPLMEYNHIIWNPNLKRDIQIIESVQRKFTRLLCQKLNIKYNDYKHRLQILNIESLEGRRIRSDLVTTYKLLNNLIDLDPTDFFITNNIKNKYNLRRNPQYLKHPKLSNTAVRRTFFSNRVIKIWNTLPTKVVMSTNLTLFKNNLKSIDLSKFSSLS